MRPSVLFEFCITCNHARYGSANRFSLKTDVSPTLKSEMQLATKKDISTHVNIKFEQYIQKSVFVVNYSNFCRACYFVLKSDFIRRRRFTVDQATRTLQVISKFCMGTCRTNLYLKVVYTVGC